MFNATKFINFLLILNIIGIFIAYKEFNTLINKNLTIDEDEDENYGECENEESENIEWYSDDCNIQQMYAIRARDYYKRGLITPKMAKAVISHYREFCYKK